MFAYRDSRDGGAGRQVGAAFTGAGLDLQGTRPGFPAALARVEAEAGVGFARLSQVHGADVVVAGRATGPDEVPVGDALVTAAPGVGLMVRVADCVPVLLADARAGVVGAVHSGRPGMVLDVVTATLAAMAGLGARRVTAWVGPHVCGACYEVPAAMREQVAAAVPESWSETSWGTPALDLGAGVRAQLGRARRDGSGVEVDEVVDVDGCTLEDERLHSYRRDGADAGRSAGLVWVS